MILETERLLLQDYQLENLDDFYNLKSCKEVWNYSTFIPLKEKNQARPLLESLISVHKAKPCPLCARSIIQAGIANVILRIGEKEDEYLLIPAKELIWHN